MSGALGPGPEKACRRGRVSSSSHPLHDLRTTRTGEDSDGQRCRWSRAAGTGVPGGLYAGLLLALGGLWLTGAAPGGVGVDRGRGRAPLQAALEILLCHS